MHYEIVKAELFTRKGAVLLALMATGAFAFLLRFGLGLGMATNLSDNYPWGLWIAFDLIWIALAGGAFVTAGIVYILMAEEFHPLARPAVWMGFLSYNFVVVTLLADLGLPWHFWRLATESPEHSAMYEVSWCVGLYVTVLGLEFIPTVFERFGWEKLKNLWRQLSPIYTVIALGLFVFLMSHKIWMAILALVVFTAVAFLTRDSYKHSGVPIILIVAAVTFSTMHQSSLGSLFLLMPDKLSHLWWSPIMSLLFFLSAVASGIALVMAMEMLVSYYFKRPFQWKMLAGMGKVLWIALVIYYGFRIVDVIWRGQLAEAFSGRQGALFLIEIIGGGLIPLAILSTQALRNNKNLLVLGTALALGGVIFNRVNVVIFGMNLHGTQPGGIIGTYYPSAIEWAVSISLIAAAVFFFAAGAKLLPILPKVEDAQ